MSACGLFASAYASTAAQQELRALFASLARDETPMVRRAVAQHLGKFAAAVAAPELLQSALLPVFSELTLDGASRACTPPRAQHLTLPLLQSKTRCV